jgi:hypothetical protein
MTNSKSFLIGAVTAAIAAHAIVIGIASRRKQAAKKEKNEYVHPSSTVHSTSMQKQCLIFVSYIFRFAAISIAEWPLHFPNGQWIIMIP